MPNPSTITIDNVKYIREDSVPVQPSCVPMTSKRIVAADRGWVFAGDCEDHADGTITIYNAKNIRRWGTSAGLGELVNGPIDGKTVVDVYGTVRVAPIVQINIIKGW